MVYVQPAHTPGRKTPYDLVSVYKGERLVNIDSQAPNKVAREWLLAGGVGEHITFLKPEAAYHDSRLDFYYEAGSRKRYIEVKGVTLEQDGLALFPDAPTLRGVRHLQELCRCVEEGYEAMALFVIQMQGVNGFAPNDTTHPAFREALRQAQTRGVQVLALDCRVTPEGMWAGERVAVRL